jgi:hypothetical protein
LVRSAGAIVVRSESDIPLKADLLTLTRRRQAQIDNRLLRANAKHIPHEYKVNDSIYIQVPDRNKLDLRLGPFPILQVHTNNTVTVQRGPIHERMSIRHILPCKHSGSVLVRENV